jgi:hypothetical protein
MPTKGHLYAGAAIFIATLVALAIGGYISTSGVIPTGGKGVI